MVPADREEDTQVIPRWLWGSVGAAALLLATGLGSIGTWVILKTIEHNGMLIEHSVRISGHDRELAEIRSQYAAIDGKLDTIIGNNRP